MEVVACTSSRRCLPSTADFIKWSCASPEFNAMLFGVALALLSPTWETNYAATPVPIPNVPSVSFGPTPIQHAVSMLIESQGQLT
jgi:hypothetical protein